MADTTNIDRIKVLIVDDHTLFNDGLMAMLSKEPTVEVVGQIYQSKETPHALLRFTPDILLMDFNMPGINGLEMTRQLLRSLPQLRILILSMYAEPRYIDDFQKAGAKGYLLKTATIDELMTAIHAVMAGQSYFKPKPSGQAKADPHAADHFLKKFKLTEREGEVIGHIREGLTNQQIAELMCVSFYTVETHRRNIYFKLGVKSATELIRFMQMNE